MISCSHCYEIFPDEFIETNEYCPFCHTMLPEPEPEPEPEPIYNPNMPIGVDGMPIQDGQYVANGEMYPDATVEPPKSKTPMIFGIIGGVIVLVIAAYFMMGGKKKSATNATQSKTEKKIDPKLIASLDKLNQTAQKQIDKYFMKTCSTFQAQGYAFETELVLDKNGNWKAKIIQGNGTPLQNENIFLCPVNLTEIRSKSDLTLKVQTRFQSGGLFGNAANFAKIEIIGKNFKTYDNFKNPTKELMTPKWSFAKGKMHILIGGLRKAPESIRKLNGTFEAFFKGRKKRAKLHIKIHGTELVQLNRKAGPAGIFGTYQAKIPGWFGEAQTKYIKDWGTGCVSDITEQFNKIKKQMIEQHDDLELFENSPQLKEYLDKAQKASNSLCSVMSDAYKIIKLYDEDKRNEASSLEANYRKALLQAHKALRIELLDYINSLRGPTKAPKTSTKKPMKK